MYIVGITLNQPETVDWRRSNCFLGSIKYYLGIREFTRYNRRIPSEGLQVTLYRASGMRKTSRMKRLIYFPCILGNAREHNLKQTSVLEYGEPRSPPSGVHS